MFLHTQPTGLWSGKIRIIYCCVENVCSIWWVYFHSKNDADHWGTDHMYEIFDNHCFRFSVAKIQFWSIVFFGGVWPPATPGFFAWPTWPITYNPEKKNHRFGHFLVWCTAPIEFQHGLKSIVFFFVGGGLGLGTWIQKILALKRSYSQTILEKKNHFHTHLTISRQVANLYIYWLVRIKKMAQQMTAIEEKLWWVNLVTITFPRNLLEIQSTSEESGGAKRGVVLPQKDIKKFPGF